MVVAQQARPLIEFTWTPLFEDYGIPLAIMGVLVVFLALLLVVAFINILPRLMSRISAQSTLQSALSAADNLSPEDTISPETLAVIAAAVHETISQPHRVVKIRGLTQEGLGWSLEGRTQHHQSHKFLHRDRR